MIVIVFRRTLNKLRANYADAPNSIIGAIVKSNSSRIDFKAESI